MSLSFFRTGRKEREREGRGGGVQGHQTNREDVLADYLSVETPPLIWSNNFFMVKMIFMERNFNQTIS